ncbi:MAG: hypothetical protein RR639_08285 [Hydrogenoanaerobacterium sp.]
MKKRTQAIRFISKLTLLILPIIAYYIVFLVYEPFNYFGLQQIAREYNTPLPRLREYMRDEEDFIIVGDSRMAHIDMNEVYQVSGERYANLSFGGASFKETIDMFWFAVEKNSNIRKVIFQISYYTLNKNYNLDRVEKIIKTSENPLEYLLNYEYNAKTVEILKTEVSNKFAEPLPIAQDKAAAGNVSVDYEVFWKEIYNANLDYTLDLDNLQKLNDVVSYCKSKGIELLFVIPPMHQTIWDNVITPLNLQDDIQQYKDVVKNIGVVYDMEYADFPQNKSDDFWDGFHFYGDTDLEHFYIEQVFKS